MIRSFEDKTPRIAPSAFVSEAALVVGDVEIGECAGIWPGAVIRGDFAPIRIGRNTMVEDNAVVHTGGPLEIGESVIIGHNAVVHCRRVGNNCLIGNNATLLDNAELGHFCIVAAGAVVGPGKIIPEGSLVAGVPARIRGRVTADQRQRLERGSSTYVELAARYKADGL
ncbi:MAG: gamma carbonic anhydrase family protein [Desulfobacteraceae bacterium]|nr:MAG: gamma carbonic anhydrase family protein [Desulfobacteraceae bacterium]